MVISFIYMSFSREQRRFPSSSASLVALCKLCADSGQRVRAAPQPLNYPCLSLARADKILNASCVSCLDTKSTCAGKDLVQGPSPVWTSRGGLQISSRVSRSRDVSEKGQPLAWAQSEVQQGLVGARVRRFPLAPCGLPSPSHLRLPR